MNGAVLAVVAGGGAIGSVLRYLVGTLVTRMVGPGFPFGTLVVNIVGSLLIGLVYVLLVERLPVGALWRVGVISGVLGGFTTFSAFSFETVALLEEQAYGKAALYVTASVILCLSATWMGIVMARRL